MGIKETWRFVEDLSGHCPHDWSDYVNVIGVICEPFAVKEDSE